MGQTRRIKKQMKKTYIIEKAKNGFIIKFDHLKMAFEVNKLCVAKDLKEVYRILKEDLEAGEIIEVKESESEPEN